MSSLSSPAAAPAPPPPPVVEQLAVRARVNCCPHASTTASVLPVTALPPAADAKRTAAPRRPRSAYQGSGPPTASSTCRRAWSTWCVALASRAGSDNGRNRRILATCWWWYPVHSTHGRCARSARARGAGGRPTTPTPEHGRSRPTPAAVLFIPRTNILRHSLSSCSQAEPSRVLQQPQAGGHGGRDDQALPGAGVHEAGGVRAAR